MPIPKRRSAGILLHPTSLPGPYGVGDLGPVAFAWVDALTKAKQSWWQVLPLGPPGAGDSPYQCFSALAGNPLLISPDELVKDGLIAPSDLAAADFAPGRVDYARVGKFKTWLLDRAWQAFEHGAAAQLRDRFEHFRHDEAGWLDDYALFAALKQSSTGSWHDWPAPLVRREPVALAEARKSHADAIGREQLAQFLFFRQWDALRQHANARGVKLFGDAPIFVSGDSADVWANPRLFLLDADRRPKVVAGVPPDYFSATGQLWGNPLYDWKAHAAEGFAWWKARMRMALRQVDLVRLDHFRGFEAAWHVPAGDATAVGGAWVPGPGAALFEALRADLGGLPLVAEDLGLISRPVHVLREQFGLPGMYILQFAFGGEVDFRFLPHNHRQNAVVYTGTHDNDTTAGWWAGADEGTRAFVRKYYPHADADPVNAMIRAAWSSVADFALMPLQDALGLGRESRMNVPGVADGNWSWRCTESQITPALIDGLAALTELYNRHPGPERLDGE